MRTWIDFAGEARWDDGRLAFRHDGAAHAGTASPDGRELFLAGEVHGDGATAAERIRRLFVDAPSTSTPVAGGYAAALVDRSAQTVTLATDPAGIRPLYYWSDGHRVVFATRLADLVRVGGLRPALDATAVYHYLNYAYVPGPGTIFRDVFVLSPGSVARCANGKVDVRSHWDMTYPADLGGTEGERAAALRQEIERAVRDSRVADLARGATGCFLSGGTDSGTVAALLSRAEPGLPAYSIAFAEDAWDELAYARLLAARYGLRHHVHVLTVADLLDSIPVLGDAFDQPFGNPSAVGMWRCVRLARETGADLLVAGDGGDELFGGNERYAKDRVYAAYHRLPAAVRRSLRALAHALPGDGLLPNRIRNFADRGDLPNPARLYADDALASKRWDGLVGDSLRRGLTRQASLDVMRAHWDRIGPVHEIDRLMYVDLKTAIWGNDLLKVVSSARAAGTRVRFPFLDPRLASFTGRLGGRMKVRGLRKRYLFKRAVADLLPRRVLDKPKHGFGVPVAEWIRRDRRVREAVLDPILDAASPLGDYLTRSGREALVEEHLAGRWDHGAWLWALMMLARWQERWSVPNAR